MKDKIKPEGAVKWLESGKRDGYTDTADKRQKYAEIFRSLKWIPLPTFCKVEKKHSGAIAEILKKLPQGTIIGCCLNDKFSPILVLYGIGIMYPDEMVFTFWISNGATCTSIAGARKKLNERVN